MNSLTHDHDGTDHHGGSPASPPAGGVDAHDHSQHDQHDHGTGHNHAGMRYSELIKTGYPPSKFCADAREYAKPRRSSVAKGLAGMVENLSSLGRPEEPAPGPVGQSAGSNPPPAPRGEDRAN